MDIKLLQSFRQRYANVFPLIFLRTMERAKTPGKAFDILETLPQKYPIIWDEETNNWMTTENILQHKD